MNWCNGVIEIKRISFWELNIKCEGRWQTYKKGDIYLLNILKLSTQHWIILIFQRDIGFFPLQNSIIQEKSVTSLKSPAPVGDRSQDGGTTKGRAAVRSLFTGDARETAITSHRSWPVSGDVEGQPEERVGSHNQKPGKRDLLGNILCMKEAASFHILMTIVYLLYCWPVFLLEFMNKWG